MNFYLREDKKLISLIKKEKVNILDVGCGQGRYLIPLSKLGHNVFGIDINVAQVSKLRSMGYRVFTPSEFEEIDIMFDYVIMSHIIEHINPDNLIDFLDKYLSKLKYGGELIIATPFLYNEFYDDYDHIKPYTPKAISALYSDYEQQQKKPKYRLKLKYVWIRKWPIILFIYPGEPVVARVFKKLFNKIFFVLYKISFGIISRSTGWIGVFEKVS
jgi:SAM-dependent methyltransferase